MKSEKNWKKTHEDGFVLVEVEIKKLVPAPFVAWPGFDVLGWFTAKDLSPEIVQPYPPFVGLKQGGSFKLQGRVGAALPLRDLVSLSRLVAL